MLSIIEGTFDWNPVFDRRMRRGSDRQKATAFFEVWRMKRPDRSVTTYRFQGCRMKPAAQTYGNKWKNECSIGDLGKKDYSRKESEIKKVMRLG
jgi:hypothetical protein